MSHSSKIEFATRWSWSDPMPLHLVIKISEVFYGKPPSPIAEQLGPHSQLHNESPAQRVSALVCSLRAVVGGGGGRRGQGGSLFEARFLCLPSCYASGIGIWPYFTS